MAQNKEKSLIKKRTYEFALRIIDLYRMLISANEYVLSKQLLKLEQALELMLKKRLRDKAGQIFSPRCLLHQKKPGNPTIGYDLSKIARFLKATMLMPFSPSHLKSSVFLRLS
jgi:hypothetical protein